ncbi:hypothetical protein KY333_00115 [Candidatus Woesearchaeota archaeon]|nr:hypothetical protein [Candidatus Woesearchaeota archaeon]
MKETDWLKQACRIAYANKGMFLLSCALDIILLLVYGFVTAPIYAKLLAHINVIGSYAGTAVQEATRYSKGFASVLLHESIKPYLYDMILLLLLLAVTVYLIYCIFQALNWKIALQLTGKKISYLDYLKKFLVINIIWFIIFILYYLLVLAVDVRTVLITTITQAEPSSVLNIILTFYLILLAYFAAISYATLSVKKSWQTGTKKIKQLFPSILMIAAYVLLLNIITGLLITYNPILGLILGAILLIPAFTIGRIYISLIINKM